MRRRTLFVLPAFAALPAMAEVTDARSAILHLLRQTFDRPDAPLDADPIVVVDDRAIVDWSQGGTGGRALLHRQAGGWAIVLCSGAALKGTDLLRTQGVPASQAEALIAALRVAEATVTAERLALFDSFEGLMLMEPSGAHPTHGAAPAHR